MKKKAEIDVAVLLIFFVRDKQFAKVFEQVKIARPSRLYLYQDGPRENRSDDMDVLLRCREIADDIDWECDVHKFYQEKNVGCDPSEYIAQKWMFETEEMGIVLEDDDVPSQSFFPFCKELLERYKDDERVHIICGMNNIGVSKDISTSYFFTKKGSIWGWASWRRVLNTWDGQYSWLDDPEKVEKLRNAFDNLDEYKTFLFDSRKHKETGKAHYETINAASLYFNYRLNIVPKYNMISNIGVGEETTHGASSIKVLPKYSRRLLYMKTYDIKFPMDHPSYVIQNKEYEKNMTLTKKQLFLNRMEGILLRLRYGDFQGLIKSTKKRLGRK